MRRTEAKYLARLTLLEGRTLKENGNIIKKIKRQLKLLEEGK